MSNYNSLKTTIDANIKQNGRQEITGQILNSVLNQMVTTLGAGYQFAGVATTATNPGTPDAKVFYIANGKGTYTNFGGINVTEDEVVVLYYDTEWHKEATGIASQAKLTELEYETNELGYNVKNISAQTNNVYYYDENKILKGYFASNGNFYPSTGYYSIRVKVEANTTYTIPRAIFFVNFYNGYDHLSSYKVGDGSTQVIGNITFTTPSDCNNIAITTYYEGVNPPYFATYMVWKGNTYPNYYVKPYVIPELAEKVNKNGINEVTKRNADFISLGNNLFDLSNTEIKNGYIAKNGNFYPSSGYHSFFVLVGENVTFTIPNYILCLVYYSGNEVISATDVIETEKTTPTTFTTPLGCTKIAINVVDSRDLTYYMVWKGDTYPSSFEPFGYYLEGVNVDIKKVFDGKNCIQLGDSITWYDGHQQEGITIKGYASYLREQGMFVNNMGVSGACITNLSQYTDVCEVVAQIKNFADYDYCTIMAGVNDYMFCNSPIGEFAESNFNLGIFTQAYQYIIESILTQSPSIKIILGTPLKSLYKTDANTQGKYLSDYVDRIKEIANRYSLPIVDLYNISGLNKLNIPTLTIDGLHPNNEGYSLISNKLIEAVRGI